ncbi:titin [Helicoverpa armigera]|uniref:titin n=1 Tax=Helicoverpa armigera TaxID=29058 RepID=UPI003082B442
MDRLSHLRGEAGGSRDSTLDTTSPPSEGFMTANESSSKYFSLSEVDSVDSTFDISSIKDVSLASTTTDSEGTMTNADDLISNLSPIGKKSDMLDSYKIGKQIEAANILSGGVDIFDDNDNSYDGDELVIDDNVDVDDKSNSELKDAEGMEFKSEENLLEPTLINEETDIASKDTEVVLQIDGKNVDAIDIGNGLYLYRKEGQEELAAVQIIDDDQQQTSFKFLKVRENAEGNLEVYEEIEIEVPKEVPAKEGKMADKKISSHVPIKDINKVISESACNKVAERKNKIPRKEPILTTTEVELDGNKETSPDAKSEVNINGKMMKFSESRKSPVIGSFTPMTYHSTPNKERIPLTKTMVDQQLHPSRHSDNVKKTIEVHTDSSKQRTSETPTKNKEEDDSKVTEVENIDTDLVIDESVENVTVAEEIDKETVDIKNTENTEPKTSESSNKEVAGQKCSTVTDKSAENLIEKPEKVTGKSEGNIIEKPEKVTGKSEENIIEKPEKIPEKSEETVIEKSEENVIEKVGKVDDKPEKAANSPVADLNKEKDILKEDVPMEVDEVKKQDNSENIVNVDEIKILDTVEDTVDKVEETIEEVIESDSDNQLKIDEVIEVSQEEVKISEPIQIVNDDVKIVEVSDTKDKDIIAKDNTHGDSQEETKVEEIIYDITDQENDEIVIIDDSEIDETKIEESTSVNEKSDKQAEDVVNKEAEKLVIDVTAKNGAEDKQHKNVQDNNKKGAENIEADSTSAVTADSSTEKLEKDDTPTASETVKNNVSKIPVAKPDTTKESKKEEIKPTSSTSSVMKAITKPTDSKPTNSADSKPTNSEKKVESIEKPSTSVKEVERVKEDIVLEKEIPHSHIPIKELPKLTATSTLKIHERPILVPEIKPVKRPIVTSAAPSKTDKVENKKENNVLEKSPKKESKELKQPIPIVESQLTVVPMVVDSSTNVKMEIAGKSNVTVAKVSSKDVKEQKHIPQKSAQPIPESKPLSVTKKEEKHEVKVKPKDTTEPAKSSKDIKVNRVPKDEDVQPSCSGTQDVSSTSTDNVPSQSSDNKNESEDNREDSNGEEPKPGGSKKAVPFGKWTATNRKEFLDKIKNRNTTPVTPAVPSTSTNQLKNSNDLNRRDVLQKIDSQRQSSSAAALAKTQEANKVAKNEPAFSKVSLNQNKETNQESKTVKVEKVKETSEAVAEKAPVKQEVTNNEHDETSQAANVANVKKDPAQQRTEVNYQDLIDKTIEDMIHRKVAPPKAIQEEPDQSSAKDPNANQNVKYPLNYEPTDRATLDEIEMKMNELHGIPFIERPPHELPVVPIADPKPKVFTKAEKEKPAVPSKTTKIPNLLPFSNKVQQKIAKDSVIEVDSEEEIIEHEPITGDINVNKKIVAAKLLPKDKVTISRVSTDKAKADAAKKESIITEKDFDKFARRNSITYENRLTVNFDNKEPHNVIKTVVEKDPYPKSYSRNDIARAEPKAKMPYKYQNVRQSIQPPKVHATNKVGAATEDSSNRNQSKLQKAYQSALSAKRQKECPITIIEDKPVKVVFMDNMEFVPNQLNVQGQQLSPAKKIVTEPDDITVSTLDSLESDVLDTTDDAKSQEEVKTKTKHQRKQVLTPVDEPELELIEPRDLGLEVSPKKKRKTEEDKTDNKVKYPMRKKHYLLGSNAADDKFQNTTDVIKNPLKETINRNDNGVAHKNAVSAIDNLVKAAELLEHSENLNIIDSPNPDSQQSTPVKRGRGRPRKYPLPEGAVDKNKVPSPQKKPRLIDAKVPKRDVVTTTDDDDSDDEIIKENWTMGKINENIVCPICNKLFRTENVVFKHVKHCTGPSPSRSGSDKRSPRRMRPSQESDSKSQGSQSDDMDIDDDKPLVVRKETPKKRKSKDSVSKPNDIDDVIVIEDTPPAKEKPEKKDKEVDERKVHESRKPRAKIFHSSNDLVCEFCGKTFRQLSYLVSHKLQHKKDEPKKVEKEAPVANKSVYSCEVCKKEFRKLHHLVQHRIIHNPSSAPARSLRKSSSEQSDTKIEKEPASAKASEDAGAGFRCEPCDKSFRKLHHLVEHRETHDGINRQKITPVVEKQNHVEKEKPITLHQCEVCKKSFRKLHHLIEHKEQHVETSSEKSDDKSVKSSLSTRDIIHECSLCYMVFPNEHSLNKHTIICQRKKRQSKQSKPAEESEVVESVEETSESPKIEEKLDDVDSPKPDIEEVKDEDSELVIVEKVEPPKETTPTPVEQKPVEVVQEKEKETETIPQKVETKSIEPPVVPAKREFEETKDIKVESEEPEVPEKIKKVEVKETKVHETPKKKILKDKSAVSASKRVKTTAAPVHQESKPAVESSDDDEVRYMLNPNFKVEDTAEEKVFMKVRANKRSSLQIERPNSKDLVKRRTSLQHPPKILRLKPKVVEANPVTVKHVAKAPKLEPVPSTDSDDSETVKYSFPKTIPEKSTKPAQERTPKDVEKKTQKKSLADKRKSLSGIAKRKSLGKAVTARHKPSPVKQIKRRTLEVEHRCDCGQLFSSAALLARHTSLAHTPPRVRRRRDPPPDPHPPPDKPDKHKQASRKSSARSDSSTSTKPNKPEPKPTRKSLDKDPKPPADAKKPKPEKSEAKSSVKPRRTPAHRGVPVPEKMRKIMQKNK